MKQQKTIMDMADLNRRLQVLLSEEQFAFLRELSRKTRKGTADLVRSAIDRTYRPSSGIEKIGILEKLAEKKFLHFENHGAVLAALRRRNEN